MTPDEKFLALGDEIPPVFKLPETLNFIGAKIVGNTLHLSGVGPLWGGGNVKYPGQIPTDVSEEDAVKSARLCGLNLLNTVRDTLGSLDKVEQVISVQGYVNCGPGFTEHAPIINGCSDLLYEIFGEKGKHVRVAMGVSSLPLDFSVEVQMQLEVK